jgi:uncharacterized protein YkwD
MEMMNIRLSLFAAVALVLSGCSASPSGGNNRRGQQSAAEVVDKDKDKNKKDEKVEPVILDDDKKDTDSEDNKDDDKKDEDKEDEVKPTDCYKAEPKICAMEKEVFELTNKLRQQQGRDPLVLDSEMSWAARQWSIQMGKSGFISHMGFPGSRMRDYQSEFGKAANMNAENVAMNYTSDTSAASSFYDMWKNSPGHRRNMLGNSRTIGIGLAKNSRGGWYATQIFGQ